MLFLYAFCRCTQHLRMLKGSGFQNVVSRPAASILPGNSPKMQIIGVQPRPMESTVCFNKPFKRFWCLRGSQFKNHYSRNSVLCLTWLNKAFSNRVLGNSTELLPYQEAFLWLSQCKSTPNFCPYSVSATEFNCWTYHITLYFSFTCLWANRGINCILFCFVSPAPTIVLMLNNWIIRPGSGALDHSFWLGCLCF